MLMFIHMFIFFEIVIFFVVNIIVRFRTVLFILFFYGTMPDLLRGEKTLCDFNYIMIDSY